MSSLESGARSIVPVIRHNAERLGQTVALRFLVEGDLDGAQDTLAFAALDARARAIAGALQQAGLRGERALMLYAPGLDFVAAFLGCLYAGVVAVPAYPPDLARLDRTLPRLRAIAANCGARAVLTTSAIAALADALAPGAPELGDAQWIATDAIAPGEAVHFRAHDARPDEVAFLQYTSGSTATPRGVMVTHGNLLHNSQAISRAVQADQDSLSVVWLPSYHDMGLIGGILNPLFSGFPAVLMAPGAFLSKPGRWLRAISHFRATASAFPNFALDLCVRKVTDAECARLDLSSWHTALNGAEPVRVASLARFVQRFGPCGLRPRALVPVYGLAESTLIVTGGPRRDEPVVREVSRRGLGEHRVEAPAPDDAADTVPLVGCGEPVAGLEVRVVDPERRVPCEPGSVGEIWVRGPSVAAGYWNQPEATAATFDARLADGGAARADEPAGGYLRTGDLGFVDGGQLFVTGRRKDVIIVRGANYYPQDIEDAAERAHADMRRGCSVAVALEGSEGEYLAVVAEVRNGLEPADLDAVVLAIRTSVVAAVGLAPRTVALVPPGSVPKTSSGKLQRHACREEHLRGALPVLRLSERAAPGAARPAPLAGDAV